MNTRDGPPAEITEHGTADARALAADPHASSTPPTHWPGSSRKARRSLRARLAGRPHGGRRPDGGRSPARACRREQPPSSRPGHRVIRP